MAIFAVYLDDDDDDDDEDDEKEAKTSRLKRKNTREDSPPFEIDLTLFDSDEDDEDDDDDDADSGESLFFSSYQKSKPKKKTRATKFSLQRETSANFAFTAPAPLSVSQQQQPQPNARPGVTKTATVDRSSLWIEKYAPRSMDELAVHKKKVESVRDWLDDSFKGFEAHGSRTRQKLLILTGPSGCAKTATVSVLAAEMKFDIIEWINPAGFKRVDVEGKVSMYEHQMKQFASFLLRARHYQSLDFEGEATAGRKVILVEDVPFLESDSEQLEQFRACLASYFQHATFPLVFILCDTSSGSSSLDYILGDLKSQRMRYEHIAFRAINLTLMSKVLRRVLEQEQISVDNEKEVFAQIHEESKGDVRAALNNLQVFCVGEVADESATLSGSVSSGHAKRRKKIRYANLGLRDSAFSLFRGLGKVFHAKRDEVSEKVFCEYCAHDLSFAEGKLACWCRRDCFKNGD